MKIDLDVLNPFKSETIPCTFSNISRAEPNSLFKNRLYRMLKTYYPEHRTYLHQALIRLHGELNQLKHNSRNLPSEEIPARVYNALKSYLDNIEKTIDTYPHLKDKILNSKSYQSIYFIAEQYEKQASKTAISKREGHPLHIQVKRSLC